VRTHALVACAAIALIGFAARDAAARERPATAVVRTTLARELTRQALAEHGIEVLHVYRDGRADLAVTDEALRWIESLGVPVAVLERLNLTAPAALDENLGQYHTYAEMNALLDSLAAARPDLARIDTIGRSWEGRLIRAIKISDNVGVDGEEPELLIMGCHHSREIMSVEVPLLFAKYLLENYGTDQTVTNLVDTREVWIVPMLNVDGHVYVEQNHGGSSVNWWNKNRRLNTNGSYGVDLNRNYGYMWGYNNTGSSGDPSASDYRGLSAFSERENQAIRNLCMHHHFAISLSYHSYGEEILFPWGYVPEDTPDNDTFFSLGYSMQEGNDYLVGNAASGAIYITNGDSDDWLYGDTQTKNRVFGFTVELNSWDDGGYAPPESLIGPTCAMMFALNLTAMELAGDALVDPGPLAPAMHPVSSADPPAYEVSWSPAAGDPHPALTYELTEMKNLAGAPDSVESPDELWAADGFTLSSDRAYVGSSSFYSGRGDGLFASLTMATVYPAWFPTTLSCRLWYDIENGFDYAYLEGSADDGLTWITLPGSRTTNSDPNGNNLGNGITGSSGGWVAATFDLSSLVGSGTGFALLRFVYITDSAVNHEGLYVDLVDPVPRTERSSVIVTGFGGTQFAVQPHELGDFTYCVRGFEATGIAGRRSNLASWTVSEVSGAAPPPLASRLEQNFPNPFNPSTTIAFTVGGSDAPPGGRASVTLRILDVSGRAVAVLRRAELSAGAYSTTWNGLDGRGAGASSGVYFAELRVGRRVLVRKMVLLR
jgi:hypothetical protein